MGCDSRDIPRASGKKQLGDLCAHFALCVGLSVGSEREVNHASGLHVNGNVRNAPFRSRWDI